MKKIPVVFGPEMVAGKVSFSPSSAKPELAVRSWKEHGFPVEIEIPEPMSRESLYRVHKKEMVDNILDLEESNGFGTKDPDVARSLQYTSGAMCLAALYALANEKVACAPVSGFHHAGHGYNGGFCTFNGLMATAIWLLDEGLADKVGIIDYDMHYGDGTDDIIETLGVGKKVLHFTYGKYANRRDKKGNVVDPVTVVKHIPTVVRWMKEKGVDVILYQAGADPHENDPLGGHLTSEEMVMRERLLFETAKECGIPVAWNLAGGYQTTEGATLYEQVRPVLDIHDATMRVCAEVYCDL